MHPNTVLRKKRPNAQPLTLAQAGPIPVAPTVPPWFADRFPGGTVITSTTALKPPDRGPFLSRLLGATNLPGEGTWMTKIVAKSPRGKVLGSTSILGPTVSGHGLNGVPGVVPGRKQVWV